VTARVDVEDIGSVALLERRGFRLMDALVTYRVRLKEEHPKGVREVGAIRDFEDRDTDEVLEITREAFSGYAGRFQHDPHIPSDRAGAFYLEWARKCMSRDMADKLLVSVNAEGHIIGFLFFRRREPASTVGGAPIFGGGLGGCRRDTPGAYAGLIRAATLWAHHQGGVAECQTQNYNFPVIRVYEAAGATYVRAEYMLHAWLGA
jgi:RimJ/RimL family protein N-acetyltransferase